MHQNLRLHTIVSEPFAENSYIVGQTDGRDVFIVDPGFDTKSILQYVEDERVTPRAILNTHGHVDHIAGNRAMKRAFPDAPLIIGIGDAPMLTDAFENMRKNGHSVGFREGPRLCKPRPLRVFALTDTSRLWTTARKVPRDLRDRHRFSRKGPGFR